MDLLRHELEVAAPFRLDLTVWALRRRPHNAVDFFDGAYRRAVATAGCVLEVAVRQRGGARRPVLELELRSAGAGPSTYDVAEALDVLRRVLGLDVELSGFYRLAGHDDRLTALAASFRGVRPPRFPSVFEALVNAIACQQLSLSVGIHLLNRLAAGYGPSLGDRGGSAAGFPGPDELAGAEPEQLRAMGFSRSKAQAVIGLAARVASGELDLESLHGADDDEARAVLLEIPGVGRWSAEYTLLRGLGRLHVLPGDDVGARNNLRRRYGLSPAAGYDELSALSRSWWPYGGFVYFHLLLDTLAGSGHVEPNRAAPPWAVSPRRRPSRASHQGARR